MITLESRLQAISSLTDYEAELKKAVSYAKTWHRRAKDAPLLADALALKAKAKAADDVVRTLRLSVFDIEDALANGVKSHELIHALKPQTRRCG